MIPANSPLVAALSPYEQSDVLTTTTVTYSFMDAGISFDAGDVDGEPRTSVSWTQQQRDTVRDLFTYISTIVPLTFQEIAPEGTPNIQFAQIPSFSDTTTGISIPLAPGISQIVVPTEYANLNDVTLIHEIGHSLGLSHPFDGPANLPGVSDSEDLGSFSLNTELATRMSYTPGASAAHPTLDILGEAHSYGALDIAALQLLYGENTTTNQGNTTYGDIPSLQTIWDTGGTDTIDFSGATTQATIDLRPASLELEQGGGGYLSFISRAGGTQAQGGYTIAFGVEVENAIGGAGDDILTGNGGNNMLTGGGGDDMLTGGAGTDGAVFSGNQKSYTLTLSAAETSVTDRRGGMDGRDVLSEIETLVFGDSAEAPFNLAVFGGSMTLTAAQMESFVELYIAYFNRAPDAIGLNFWGTAYANGTTLQQMATLFIDQDETRAIYAEGLSNTEFATTVYANVLGRAADQEGFDFWVGVLDAGSVGRDQFILAVLDGAKAAPPSEATPEFIAQQLADRQYLSVKTDIGSYYSVIKGMSDVADAAAAMALFDGSASGISAAVSMIDQLYTEALDPTDGAFLMPLLGVLDDPFAAMA